MKKNHLVRIASGILMAAATFFICIALADVRTYAEENNSDYSLLVEVLKEELRNGNLQTEEDVRNAIDKAEKQYGISISEEDEDRIVKLVGIADSMGIDGEKMADIVDDVYDKAIDGKEYENTEDLVNAVEEQMIDTATDTVKEIVTTTVKGSISDYFKDFFSRMKMMWARLISIWKI